MTIANFRGYVGDLRWQMYYPQLEHTLNLKPRKILEIGVGHNVLYAVLKSQGFEITSFDNAPELKPDVIGDVRELRQHFQPNSFDVVCCFQVLEHLPFEDLAKCLEQISQVSRKYVLISLPYVGITLRLNFAIARRGNREIRLGGRIPFFCLKCRPKVDHQWEPGWRDYPLSKIEKEIKLYFSITNRLFVKPNDQHVQYVLERK